MSNNEKNTGLTKDELAGLCIIIGSAMLGYKVGTAITYRRCRKGWSYMFDADPGLKTHIFETFTKVICSEE